VAIKSTTEEWKEQIEAALANLRQSFDERLAVLQSQSWATRLQSTIRCRAKLDGKVKAGSGSSIGGHCDG
jgi:hypothetical protein